MIFEEEVKKNDKFKNDKKQLFMNKNSLEKANGTHNDNNYTNALKEFQTKSKSDEKEEIEENQPNSEKFNNSFSSISEDNSDYDVSNKVATADFASKFKPHEYIPKEHLGNLLEIYSFFKYFDDLLDGPDFELEELWTSLYYNGDKYLDLIQDMHMVIINIFLENLESNKIRYESLAQKNSFSLLLMYHSGYLKDNIKEMILTVNWPDFLREIIYVYKYKVSNWEEVINILESITVASYNNTLIKNKIKIFLALIKTAEELTTFKNFHSTKSERAQDLLKSKGELQKLLMDLKASNQTTVEDIKEAEKLFNDLELKKNEELNGMAKNEMHDLVKDIKKFKNTLNTLNRKLVINEGKSVKNEKKLSNVLKELPFSIHPCLALGNDSEYNTFWIFSFHPDVIYKSNKLGHWEIFNDNKEELIHILDKNDRRQNSLKNQMMKLINWNVIEPKKTRVWKSLKFYQEDIFEYKSIYKGEERKIKTRKNLGCLLEKKLDSLYDFLVRVSIKEKCESEFLKKIIFFLDEEIMYYLNMREAFWIEEHLKTVQFDKVVNNLKSLKDFNNFVKQFEKNIAQISTYFLEEEESSEYSEEDNDKEILKPKIQTIKIDDDNEEYQFTRRKRGLNIMEIEEDEDMQVENDKNKKTNWKIKKSNLKIWNYHVQLLKKMWREFIPKNKTKSGLFFGLVIFATIIIRFTCKKIDKMNEDEERERIKHEEEQEENRRLKKKSDQDLSKNYTIRKAKYANRKNIKNCKECKESIESESEHFFNCYSCENLFHSECIKKNLNRNTFNDDNWRCSYCLNKIKNSRMTRKLRKELKYYDD